MKKRLIGCLLVIAVVLSLLPNYVVASNQTNTLNFRRMSNDGTSWFEDQDAFPMEPLDESTFGILGSGGVVRLYYGDRRLSGGVLTSSNPNVIKVEKMGETFDAMPYYEIVSKGEGTATVTYSNSEENYSYSATIKVALPDGFFCVQEFAAENYQAYPLFLEDCNNLTFWFLTRTGLTAEEADAITITFGDNGSTEQAVIEKVLRHHSSDRYDIKITFQPDKFIRGEFYSMKAMQGSQQLASITVVTEKMGKVARGFYGAAEKTDENLLENGFKIGSYEYVWFLTEDGLTEEQAKAAQVTAKQDSTTDMPLTVTPVLQQGKTDRYDLKIDVDTIRAVAHGWVDYSVCYHDGENFIQKEIWGRFDCNQQAAFTENKEYMVFFSNNPGNAGAATLESNGTASSGVYGKGEHMQCSLTPYAYVWSNEDETYVRVTDGSVTLKPEKIWIESQPYFGNPDFLSLKAGTTRVSELTGSDLPPVGEDGTFTVDCYGLEGYQNTGTVCMQVEVLEKRGNNTRSLGSVVTKHPYRGRVVYELTYEMTSDEDTTTVNNMLQMIANTVQPGQSVTLKLAARRYEGTIVIPEKFFEQTQRLQIVGKVDAGTGHPLTCVEHLDLNGAYLYKLSNVCFCASEGENPGKALYNGYCLQANRCSFKGYEVACDSTSAGYITPFNSLFVKNKVAHRVDIEDAYSNMNTTGALNCMFVDNDVAVQVLSLNNNLIPYLFRVSESNFISNTTDFDIQEAGRFYFYRNFYGKWQNEAKYDDLPQVLYLEKYNKILNYTAPRIKGRDSDTKIYTNFRWKYPVETVLEDHAGIGTLMSGTHLALLSDTSETLTAYVNTLTADWENETVILNEEAEDLTVDSSVITGATSTEEITVLDQTEALLGIWTFE